MLNQRNITTILFVLIILGSLSFGLLSTVGANTDNSTTVAFASAGINTLMLLLHLRGWPYASQFLLLIVVLSTAAGLYPSYITERFSPAMFIPPIVALVVATPFWIVATALALYISAIAQGAWNGVLMEPATLLIYGIGVGGMVLARAMSDRFLQVALEQRTKTEAALREATARSAELTESNQRLDAQIAEQRQLLDLISVLETPALALAEGMLVVPLMGHIDARRSQALTERLLQTVAEQRARLVVLDIAGVAVLDTGVAHTLTQTVQAIRLLGCEVVLSGISASVAMTLTQLNINLKGITTVRTPQEALRLAANQPSERKASPTPPSQPSPPRPLRSEGTGSL